MDACITSAKMGREDGVHVAAPQPPLTSDKCQVLAESSWRPPSRDDRRSRRLPVPNDCRDLRKAEIEIRCGSYISSGRLTWKQSREGRGASGE